MAEELASSLRLLVTSTMPLSVDPCLRCAFLVCGLCSSPTDPKDARIGRHAFHAEHLEDKHNQVIVKLQRSSLDGTSAQTRLGLGSLHDGTYALQCTRPVCSSQRWLCKPLITFASKVFRGESSSPAGGPSFEVAVRHSFQGSCQALVERSGCWVEAGGCQLSGSPQSPWPTLPSRIFSAH